MSLIVTALLLAPFSGLQVKVLRPGIGYGAAKGDVLTMLYRGTLKDGKVFDENSKKPPFAFRLGAGQVIKGWDQGLIGAKRGSKLHLTIPPELGYGAQAVGPIPANSTLTFEVEVLRIDRQSDKPKVEIQEVKRGSGAAAGPNSKVKVHYRGTFVNGVEFDKSKEPFEVELGAGMVIPGFESGLVGMKVGGKRKVTIPFALAYGESGRPPQIPRMATLVFELILVDVVK